MKTWIIGLSFIISFSASANESEQEALMTPEQIQSYMSSYDQAYDEAYEKMQSQVEDGLLTGRIRLEQIGFCHEFENKKEVDLLKLEENDPAYHQKLGDIDGGWDAKKQGCLKAYAQMQERLDYYQEHIKPRFPEGLELGHKVAILKMELYKTDLSELGRSCLHTPRVQGMVDFFLADQVGPEDRLAAIQADCQGQARELASIYRDLLNADQERRVIANEESSVPVRVFEAKRVPAAGSSLR